MGWKMHSVPTRNELELEQQLFSNYYSEKWSKEYNLLNALVNKNAYVQTNGKYKKNKLDERKWKSTVIDVL